MAQGFQPGAAALHMASGGAFGFIKSLVTSKPQPPKTPEEKPQTPPQQAVPAPNTIAGYAGMTAMQRREKEAGLKQGGDLQTGKGGHVPGTGQGDKIPAKYEPGEFVVSNAMLEANPGLREQLHAARDAVLAAQGTTPAQADAKNAGVIAKLAAKTRADQPSLGFAAGGAIDDEERRRQLAQIPVGGMKAPAPDGSQDQATNSELGRNVMNTVAALPGAAPALGAVSALTGATRAAPAAAGIVGNLARASAPAAPFVPPVAGAVGLMAASSPAATAAPTATQGAVAPAMPASNTVIPAQTDAQRGGATAMANPNPNQINVTRQPNGTMSFSGGPNIGKDGGDISYNAGASGFKPSGAGVTVVPGNTIASASPSTDAALSAARFAAADRGDFAAVRDSYNRQGQSFGGETRESVAADRLKELALSPRGTPGRKAALSMYRDQMAANTAGKAQDEAAKLAQQKLGLDTEELGLKKTAAGFTTRAAKRLEDLQAAYENSNPEDRPAIAEQLRVLTGKDKPAEWKAIALQGGTDAMGNKTEGVLAAVNERTGESRRLDQGGSAQAKATLPPGMTKQVGTQNGKPVYEDKSGKRFVGV